MRIKSSNDKGKKFGTFMSVLTKNTREMSLDRPSMHLTGIHENRVTKDTAHNALKITLGKLPQGGGFSSA